MKFEWDPAKAQRNAAKHRVAFDEAATVFGDPLATTVLDPRFLEGEPRFATVGHSARDRLIVVAHVDRGGRVRIISARPATQRERRMYEAGEKAAADDEMLPEYDFSGGERGKYYRRYQEGSNIVVLAPDVADVFPNAEAVNEALRLLVKLAREKARPAGKKAPGSR